VPIQIHSPLSPGDPRILGMQREVEVIENEGKGRKKEMNKKLTSIVLGESPKT